jgi:hypothetical protein
LAEVVQKYEVQEASRTLNDKSELRVIVMEAKGVPTDQSLVLIRAGNEKKTTSPEYGAHPVWEQGFSM